MTVLFNELVAFTSKQQEVYKFLIRIHFQVRAFKRFIRDYGTHYVSSAFMGAKIATMTFHDSAERLKFGRMRLLNCSEEFARRQFDLELKIEAGDEDEEDSSDEEEEMDDEELFGDLFAERRMFQ